MYWPYAVLELHESPTDAEVREAYQRKVRECPPEKDAERFSAIQQAYENLKTAEARAQIKLFGVPEKPEQLGDYIPEQRHVRNTIPMDVWLQELGS